MLLFLMLVGIGGTAIYMLTKSPFATRGMKVTTTRASALRAAITAYRNSHGGTAGTYPASLTSLVVTDGVACIANNVPASPLYQTLQGWCGPYIDQIFGEDPEAYRTDGWATPFTLNTTTGILKSCGPDLSCGTSDDLDF